MLAVNFKSVCYAATLNFIILKSFQYENLTYKIKIIWNYIVNAEITWESWLDSKGKLLDGDKSKISIDDV